MIAGQPILAHNP